MEEEKNKLTCSNLECGYNTDGYCTMLTQSQVLNNRTTCEEREW